MQLALYLNQEAVAAEELLRTRGGEFPPEEVYRLALLATGDKLYAADLQAKAELAQNRPNFPR